jgi:hypothetical protein
VKEYFLVQIGNCAATGIKPTAPIEMIEQALSKMSLAELVGGVG